MSANKLLQAASGGAGESVYVDDVFSTYLYTGTGATLNIDNGIDLDGEGGLVWIKERSDTGQHHFYDTERGATKRIHSNSTAAEATQSDALTAFNSNGFTLGTNSQVNDSGEDTCSWSFRKQEGFFDVVTYTGDGTNNRQVAHSLGSVPGCVIIKQLNTTNDWFVYHRSLVGGTTNDPYFLSLNSTNGQDTGGGPIGTPTSTTFGTGSNSGFSNISGATYVAYLFAHDDQQFGDGSDEAIIKCGSYTGNATTRIIDVGFEPQWILLKRTDSTEDWYIVDAMRGIAWPTGGQNYLRPNLTAVESNSQDNFPHATANGFRLTFEAETNGSNEDYIYVAIRRPMKTPEAGTDVLAINTRAGYTGSSQEVNTTIVPDLVYINSRNKTNEHWGILSTRLQGAGKSFFTTGNYSEISDTTEVQEFGPEQTSITLGSSNTVGENGVNFVDYYMKRATGFMDLVAYTGGNLSSGVVNHNLGVKPELVIIKQRNAISSVNREFAVGAPDILGVNNNTLSLNNNYASGTLNYNMFNTTAGQTATQIKLHGNENGISSTSGDYIAYLFATLAGVSKVGSYSGTGSNVDVDCGFSAGARFILIKRTDSTGDWYFWDSARGVVAGNDPYLLVNSTAAEVTSTDYIDPLSSGFTVTSSAPAARLILAAGLTS